MQAVHGIEPGLAPVVRQMPEIPTHNQTDLLDCGDGNVPRIVRIIWRDNTRGNIRPRQFFRFVGQRQNLFGVGKCFGKEFLDFCRSVLDFTFGHD